MGIRRQEKRKNNGLCRKTVMVAYLMVSLHNHQWNPIIAPIPEQYQKHPWWNERKGWKNYLNNLRLILQPYTYNNVISRWLRVFLILNYLGYYRN